MTPTPLCPLNSKQPLECRDAFLGRQSPAAHPQPFGALSWAGGAGGGMFISPLNQERYFLEERVIKNRMKQNETKCLFSWQFARS